MRKMTHSELKNGALWITPLVSDLKTLVYGSKDRVDWFLVVEYTRRIDFAIMYLSMAINFLILSYCLLKPKGVYYITKLFIFVLCIADLIHEITLAGRNYGVIKVLLCILLTLSIYFHQTSKGWQRLKSQLKSFITS